ncbi:MAG TPA: CARDB domain-containing protein, partial [Bacteroidia bacterium]|nr:CARDB domain-containing protein [Bacteroidia bacterium]
MKNNSFVRSALLGAVLFLATSLHAQTTLYFQNFETSKTAIPAGWAQQKAAADPTNKGWEFGNKYPGALATYVPAHTYYAFVDDYDYNTTVVANNDTLYSPSINCTGQNHVFVSFDAMFYLYNGSEVANLAVSNDGGKTWATVSTGGLPNNSFTWQDSLVYDISSYAANKANVMLAFAYFNGCPNGYNAPGVGMAIDNVDVFAPVTYDLSVTGQNLPYLMQAGSPYTFTGTIENFGGDSVVSMHLNYSVNGGPAQTDNITAIAGFNGLTTYSFSHSITYTPPSAGAYTVKFWADNLNGANVDANHKNDTLVARFMAITTIQPKMALLEEFTNASCNPCMYAVPNVDSVCANTQSIANSFRYHVWFPGRDFMDDETKASFVSTRFTYYNGTGGGVPDAQLDGKYLYPGSAGPGSLSSAYVQQAAAIGSPFTINISAATYDPSTHTFALSANITAYGNFPAGITAQVALSVDTITYKYDQSQEDPQ